MNTPFIHTNEFSRVGLKKKKSSDNKYVKTLYLSMFFILLLLQVNYFQLYFHPYSLQQQIM